MEMYVKMKSLLQEYIICGDFSVHMQYWHISKLTRGNNSKAPVLSRYNLSVPYFLLLRMGGKYDELTGKDNDHQISKLTSKHQICYVLMHENDTCYK